MSGIMSAGARRSAITLLACACLSSTLQACASRTPSDTVAKPMGPVPRLATASNPPLLLTVPAARVQRIETAQPAAPVPATSEAPGQQWVFESAKDGSLPTGAVLPRGIFSTPQRTSANQTASRSGELLTDAGMPQVVMSDATQARKLIARVRPSPAWKVTLYASPTTTAYFAALGVDYQYNVSVWQEFLGRHGIGYEVVKDADVLRYHRPAGVLLLPSAVALDDEERAAIADYRKRGGAVLATWLNGVRGALGEWTGFDFMSGTLNTGVVGDTSGEGDDVYIIPNGGDPISHTLAAGLRVWTARTAGWYPLRLDGVNTAAAIMDWSRGVQAGKPNSIISYHERVQANGLSSRVVVLGYPERTWWASEPAAMDALAYDALTWLARRPAAYLATWPAHHRSALVMALDESNIWDDGERRYADLAERLSGHASYYVLTQQMAGSKDQLRSLQARGHEIAYLGDSFDGFADQSTREQNKRVKQMVAEMGEAGIPGESRGFHAPMESYDAATVAVLQADGFRYLIGAPSSSETRLPSYAGAGQSSGILILPRTQNGPDDVLGDGRDFKDFLTEFNSAERMGGLNVLRIPGASTMDDKQWLQFSDELQRHARSMWVASAVEVANWWQERERVSVSLDDSVTPAMLTVTVQGTQALQQPVTVMVNLPRPDARLKLLSDDTEQAAVQVVRRDVWRADIELGLLSAGTHHWFVQFDSK